MGSEYISSQLLQVHLDQNVDLASRKDSTITETIRWILARVHGLRLDILDLGCGPGLYAEKLVLLGHRVTGIDFSANSIRYAKKSATTNTLNIEYRHEDYLALTDQNQYDLIMMIFTDFGVLNPDERRSLLQRVHNALKPGGIFVFDVLNPNAFTHEQGKRNWEMATSGFWRPGPYLALSDSLYYEKEKVTLNQHIIIEEDGGYAVYRFWVHTFLHTELNTMLGNAGFGKVNCHERVIADSALVSSDSVTFVTAVKGSTPAH